MFDFLKLNKQSSLYTVFSTLLPIFLGTVLATKYNGIQFGHMFLLACFYLISEIAIQAFEHYQKNKANDAARDQKTNRILIRLFVIFYLFAALLAFLIGSMTHMLITFLLVMFLLVGWLLNSEVIPLKQTFYSELLTLVFSGILPTLIAFYVQIQFISATVVQLAVFPALFILLFSLLKNRFEVNGKFNALYLLFFTPYLYQIGLISQDKLSIWSLFTFISLLYVLRCISFLTYRKDQKTALLSFQTAYSLFILFLILPFIIK
ncbi:UbiA prenyltransferase family protein [Isobaculum melis]|uniref:1,4-dihydroxy-2-naphthoate octaprenyltransferase n=1 Tax=Isobaculum melis TaxID=142588 RepID=A0A1H9TNH1_9LACT|nr:hypothetical protein [Isobaculum melis]SER98706.1 1,4-dihydroxy-2-naphthoate octaprenyltransferase [Isobaculum melis]